MSISQPELILAASHLAFQTDEVEVEETLSFLRNYAPSPISALDVGCGYGAYAVRLAEISQHVVALEPNPVLYGALLHNISGSPGLRPKISPLGLDLFDLPRSRKYDLILAKNFLSQLRSTDLRKTFERLSSLLSERGVLIFSARQRSSLRASEFMNEPYFEAIGQVQFALQTSGRIHESVAKIVIEIEMRLDTVSFGTAEIAQDIQLFDFAHLIDHWRCAGLELKALASNWAGAQYEPDAPEVVVVLGGSDW